MPSAGCQRYELVTVSPTVTRLPRASSGMRNVSIPVEAEPRIAFQMTSGSRLCRVLDRRTLIPEQAAREWKLLDGNSIVTCSAP